MLNLYRLAIVLAVALACVTSPKFALCLLVSGAAAGCYTLFVLAILRLRHPTAAVLRKV
jgi:hypothetical protein